jgi:hypothetical protein
MILLLGASWLTGCVHQPSVSGQWQEGAPRDQSFQRVLIVGMSPNFNQRCHFEYTLVRQVTSPAVVAEASCDFIKSTDQLTRESVERAVASTNADAVLTTRLVAGSLAMKEGAGRDAQGSARYKATGFGYEPAYYGYRGGVYDVPVTYAEFVTSPSISTLQGEVHIATKLYETRGASLVYSMDTKASGFESRESALADITPAIAGRLRSDGVLR